jgi:hypothetical protein
MKGLLRIAALVLLTAGIVQQSKALEAKVGELRINLAAPKGYCPLEEQNPADSQVIAAIQQSVQGRNEALASFAECDRLKAWREGKADDLGDTADYQVSLRTKGQKVSAGQTIRSVCAEFRKNGKAIYKQAEGELSKRLESFNALTGELKMNSPKMYGVLREDKTGCYIGVMHKILANDKTHTLFIVQTITVVKGQVVFFNYTGAFDALPVIQRLLAVSHSTIEATLAQN